jgi:uncharacterized protein YqeY
MMSKLLEKILDDIKTSMKAGEKDKVVNLRSLHSEIKNIGINQKIEITDDIVLGVVSKGIKQRRDSAEQFLKGNRQDLVDAANTEITWLEVYLPQQLSEDDVRDLVKNTIAEVGASSKKDMGNVMKALMPKVTGQADGKLVSRLVSELLG